MNLCHPDEHLICSQYSNLKDQKIEITEVAKGNSLHFYSEMNQIIFVIKGSLTLFCKKVNNKKINNGELFLISLHRPGFITALEDITMMVIKLNLNINFCERLPLDLLLEKTHDNEEDDNIGILIANQKIMDYATSIQENRVDNELNCCYYYDIKIREFLFLLRAYYDKKQIMSFFYPIFSGDYVFQSKIYKHLENAKTVKELAPLLNYSLSGFEKKFKRVFDVSPYQWMQEQKAKKIYHEITCSKKSFTEMSFDYGFSSPAHFNDFCRTHFNNTPGGIRKSNVKWRLA